MLHDTIRLKLLRWTAGASLAALACACDESAAPMEAVTRRAVATTSAPDAPATADELDTLTELRRLETEVPEAAVRQARSAADGPVALVPCEIDRALTAVVVVRDEGSGAILSRETYRLSPDAVSVSAGDGSEWWLARNPRYRNELRGAHADPAERLVMNHSAGDLRLTGSEELWDRAAILGGHDAPTTGLAPTGHSEAAFGLDFRQWVAPDDRSPLREVLWNADRRLTLRSRAVIDGRSFTREIVALDWSVDADSLREPSERHPDWACSELSDWGDSCEGGEHHDVGHAAEHERMGAAGGHP